MKTKILFIFTFSFLVSVATIKANDIFITSSVLMTKDMSWKDYEWKDVEIRIDWDTKTGKIEFGEPFNILDCVVTEQKDFKNPTDEVEHTIVCTAYSTLGSKLMLLFNFHPNQKICYFTITYYDNKNREKLSNAAFKFAIEYDNIFSTD